MDKGFGKLLIIGILLIGASLYLLASDFQYLFLGKTTDINQLVSENKFGEDAVSDIVTLNIKRCFGSCAKYSSRKYPDAEYYIVMLDDNSVMLIEIDSYKTEDIKRLEAITTDTLESKHNEASLYSLIYTGKLNYIKNNKVYEYYNEAVEGMKELKLIGKDVVVRDMIISGGGIGRFWEIVLLLCLFLVGGLLVFVGIKVIVEK